jgi:hypothetical protein
MIHLLLIILLFFFPASLSAGEITGFVAVDGRAFPERKQFKGQRPNNGLTAVIEPEYYHASEDDKNSFTFRPFVRLDPYDGKRTHYDIRQADWLHESNNWEVRAGLSKVFWGVIESNHLVDIINQTDAIEDVDGEDKFGQPMIQLALLKEWGALRFYYLPYFRERSFAGVNGRLRGALPVEVDNATYDASSKQWHPDFAARYSHTFDDWDVGVAHFSGTSREPVLQAGINADGANVLIPHYDLINQTSVDIQLTKDSWLWKLEGISRSGQGNRFYAASAGVEYSFYDVKESGADIGLLAEYHRDNRGSRAPFTLFDDDIFVGFRVTLNDSNDTTFLGGIMVDRNTKTRFYSIEAAKRISDDWKLELDLRIYSHINQYQFESFIQNDDHIQARLAHYF